MAEYIKREDAYDTLTDYYHHSTDTQHGALREALSRVPTADVVPVVRCKDCRYAYDSVGGWCCSHGVCVDCIVREDFFCADGARMDGDEE